MRILLIISICFFIFSSFCAAGQYYKFVDEKGVVSFTDDLSKIPKEQRPEVEVAKEIKSHPDIQSTTTTQEEVESVAPVNLESEAEALKAIKAELDRESEAINSASTILIEQGKDLKGVRNIDQYNIRVEELNARTNAYQQKQAEYVKRVNEYNAKVDAQPVKEKK